MSDPTSSLRSGRMPGDTALLVDWPEAGGTMSWFVGAKTKKGWNRFKHHDYVREN